MGAPCRGQGGREVQGRVRGRQPKSTCASAMKGREGGGPQQGWGEGSGIHSTVCRDPPEQQWGQVGPGGDIVGSSEGTAGLFRRESLGSGPLEGGCSPEPGLENGRGRTCWGGCRAEGETGESKNSLGFLPQPPGRRRLGGETEECQKAFELKAKTAVYVLKLYNASLLGQKYNI